MPTIMRVIVMTIIINTIRVRKDNRNNEGKRTKDLHRAEGDYVSEVSPLNGFSVLMNKEICLKCRARKGVKWDYR